MAKLNESELRQLIRDLIIEERSEKSNEKVGLIESLLFEQDEESGKDEEEEFSLAWMTKHLLDHLYNCEDEEDHSYDGKVISDNEIELTVSEDGKKDSTFSIRIEKK